MSHYDEKYPDESRLPTFDEATAQEKLDFERSRLIDATKELSRLKLEMEAKLRAEMEIKLRAEMEAKMKAEVEAKMRAEMEAKYMEDKIRAQEETKRLEEVKRKEDAKRALEAIKEEKRQTVLCNFPYEAPSDIVRYGGSQVDLYPPMADFVRKEKVLFSYPLHFEEKDRDVPISAVWLFITNEYVGVFRLRYTKGWGSPEVLPLYHFNESLTMRDMRILEQLYSNQRLQSGETWTALHGRIREETKTHPMYDLPHEIAFHHLREIFCKVIVPFHRQSSHPLTQFEKIICLIPGSYRNGPWKPLDGFFGVYFNEETLELSHCAPPISH